MKDAHRRTLQAIGLNMRAARHAAQLSIRDLSAAAQVQRSVISRIENGGNSRVLTLCKLCSTLGIHLCDVLPE